MPERELAERWIRFLKNTEHRKVAGTFRLCGGEHQRSE
jgi:hypothetical protein